MAKNKKQEAYDLTIDVSQFKQACIDQEHRIIADLPIYVQGGSITQQEADEVEALCLQKIKEMEAMK